MNAVYWGAGTSQGPQWGTSRLGGSEAEGRTTGEPRGPELRPKGSFCPTVNKHSNSWAFAIPAQGTVALSTELFYMRRLFNGRLMKRFTHTHHTELPIEIPALLANLYCVWRKEEKRRGRRGKKIQDCQKFRNCQKFCPYSQEIQPLSLEICLLGILQHRGHPSLHPDHRLDSKRSVLELRVRSNPLSERLPEQKWENTGPNVSSLPHWGQLSYHPRKLQWTWGWTGS